MTHYVIIRWYLGRTFGRACVPVFCVKQRILIFINVTMTIYYYYYGFRDNILLLLRFPWLLWFPTYYYYILRCSWQLIITIMVSMTIYYYHYGIQDNLLLPLRCPRQLIITILISMTTYYYYSGVHDNREMVQWGTQEQLTPPTRAAQRAKASSRIQEMSNPKTFYYPFGYVETK